MSVYDISPGVRLAAADALLNGQQTFTRAQVAVVAALAYEAGLTARVEAERAEMLCTWADHEQARPTYEQRVAVRHAEMRAGAERQRRWLTNRPTRTLGCEWPPVAAPGGSA